MLKKPNLSSKGKLVCVLKYLDRQVPVDLSELNFSPIKTKNQFLNNYSLHDKASAYVALKYLQSNFSLHPIGKDLRHKRVMIQNEVPDYYVERIVDLESTSNSNCFCIDVKSKRRIEYFGWVNERAMHGYKKLSRNCNISVYLIFILMQDGKPTEKYGYSNLSEASIKKKSAWDKNSVLIYDWKAGLPFLSSSS